LLGAPGETVQRKDERLLDFGDDPGPGQHLERCLQAVTSTGWRGPLNPLYADLEQFLPIETLRQRGRHSSFPDKASNMPYCSTSSGRPAQRYQSNIGKRSEGNHTRVGGLASKNASRCAVSA
jgi:hypothetical protein